VGVWGAVWVCGSTPPPPPQEPVLQAVDGTEADDALESSLPDERAEVGAATVWAGNMFRCSYARANISLVQGDRAL
jgi:hypothetical protein